MRAGRSGTRGLSCAPGLLCRDSGRLRSSISSACIDPIMRASSASGSSSECDEGTEWNDAGRFGGCSAMAPWRVGTAASLTDLQQTRRAAEGAGRPGVWASNAMRWSPRSRAVMQPRWRAPRGRPCCATAEPSKPWV